MSKRWINTLLECNIHDELQISLSSDIPPTMHSIETTLSGIEVVKFNNLQYYDIYRDTKLTKDLNDLGDIQ